MNYKPYSLRIGQQLMVAGIHPSPMHVERIGELITITTDVANHRGTLSGLQHSGKEFLFQIREDVDGHSVAVCSGKLKGAPGKTQPGEFNFIVTAFNRQLRKKEDTAL